MAEEIKETTISADEIFKELSDEVEKSYGAKIKDSYINEDEKRYLNFNFILEDRIGVVVLYTNFRLTES